MTKVTAEMNQELPDRIPHSHWINSQLSIARFYGAITINNKKYIVEKETGDLVIAKRKKDRVKK
jgi:hypothetical protein